MVHKQKNISKKKKSAYKKRRPFRQHKHYLGLLVITVDQTGLWIKSVSEFRSILNNNKVTSTTSYSWIGISLGKWVWRLIKMNKDAMHLLINIIESCMLGIKMMRSQCMLVLNLLISSNNIALMYGGKERVGIYVLNEIYRWSL